VNPLLRAVFRAHDLLILAMAALAAAILGGLVVLICTDVALRNLRLGNLPWSVELSEYGLYAATLLGAPWVLSLRAHVAMDLFTGLARPALRRLLDLLACALGAAICAVLAWKGVGVVLTSQGRGAMVWKTLVFPEWWFLALVPFAMAMLCLGFLRQLAETMAGQDTAPAARGH
jgi:TRAP-type C4-dicarboxylate transport system permease small subunit